jgi:hypothetical protein
LKTSEGKKREINKVGNRGKEGEWELGMGGGGGKRKRGGRRRVFGNSICNHRWGVSNSRRTDTVHTPEIKRGYRNRDRNRRCRHCFLLLFKRNTVLRSIKT